MDQVDITIIGAGVVGLACAAALAGKYDSIVVLEKHEHFGQETSSRNSEVIHSGIYYPHNSLKARLCVEGAEILYQLCDENAVPYKRLGKLIVATELTEAKTLEELLVKGTENRVGGLRLLEVGEIKKLEPSVNAIAALYSPNTGIIDSHSLMKHFCLKAENGGVLFAYSSELESIEKDHEEFVLGIKREHYRFRSRVIINCAGLSSDYIASLAGIDIRQSGYALQYCKGSYFSYAGKSPVKMLVYPVPNNELVGLGVHATPDLGGRLRFGPDAEYTDAVDYRTDPAKRDSFYSGAQRIITGLEKDAFVPDMSGIRPKLYGPREKVRDFVIADETSQGLPGLINLIGIESPGLTAAPAIAKMVSRIVEELY